MTPLELLAPAKDLTCGMAAIDHGADAVYIGAPRFGARVAAGNSIDDIRQLCDYAHRFAAKVYVTVNTLIYDDEVEAVGRLIRQLHEEAGADAILVQDMGILMMDLPPIALHASTQTDNRTADKVRWLRDVGFSRVVLARELTLGEISDIHRAVPDMPLEVFVHGAVCVSYSGLCYASHHCFGRSANRGACAQLCRMKFDLVDAEGRTLQHQRHLLSLKDMNRIDHLEALAEAGATSFKIEGRLKDLSYVKNVVAAYSRQLDAIVARHPQRYCRASAGRCVYTFEPHLDKTFNRGYTPYFLACRRTAEGALDGRQPDIFSPDTPKAMGEYVGKVKEVRRDSFTVAGTAAFANGDGLCFLNADRELEGFRVNRAAGNRLFPQQMPRRLTAGTPLYRNSSQAFERLLARPTSERKLPLDLRLEATADGFRLSAGTTSVTAVCEHQTAQKPQRENIVRQLAKLGTTHYECRGVEMAADFDFFIPSSLLADLRRRLVEALPPPTSVADAPAAAPRKSAQLPSYKHPYLYNISNRLARRFYEQQGLTDVAPAYELGGADRDPRGALLMQCRHCLRFSLGYCQRHGGRRPEWREPLFLRLADGRRFRLEFDCRHCQMNVIAAD